MVSFISLWLLGILFLFFIKLFESASRDALTLTVYGEVGEERAEYMLNKCLQTAARDFESILPIKPKYNDEYLKLSIARFKTFGMCDKNAPYFRYATAKNIQELGSVGSFEHHLFKKYHLDSERGVVEFLFHRIMETWQKWEPYPAVDPLVYTMALTLYPTFIYLVNTSPSSSYLVTKNSLEILERWINLCELNFKAKPSSIQEVVNVFGQIYFMKVNFSTSHLYADLYNNYLVKMRDGSYNAKVNDQSLKLDIIKSLGSKEANSNPMGTLYLLDSIRLCYLMGGYARSKSNLFEGFVPNYDAAPLTDYKAFFAEYTDETDYSNLVKPKLSFDFVEQLDSVNWSQDAQHVYLNPEELMVQVVLFVNDKSLKGEQLKRLSLIFFAKITTLMRASLKSGSTDEHLFFRALTFAMFMRTRMHNLTAPNVNGMLYELLKLKRQFDLEYPAGAMLLKNLHRRMIRYYHLVFVPVWMWRQTMLHVLEQHKDAEKIDYNAMRKSLQDYLIKNIKQGCTVPRNIKFDLDFLVKFASAKWLVLNNDLKGEQERRCLFSIFKLRYINQFLLDMSTLMAKGIDLDFDLLGITTLGHASDYDAFSTLQQLISQAKENDAINAFECTPVQQLLINSCMELEGLKPLKVIEVADTKLPKPKAKDVKVKSAAPSTKPVIKSPSSPSPKVSESGLITLSPGTTSTPIKSTNTSLHEIVPTNPTAKDHLKAKLEANDGKKTSPLSVKPKAIITTAQKEPIKLGQKILNIAPDLKERKTIISERQETQGVSDVQTTKPDSFVLASTRSNTDSTQEPKKSSGSTLETQTSSTSNQQEISAQDDNGEQYESSVSGNEESGKPRSSFKEVADQVVFGLKSSLSNKSKSLKSHKGNEKASGRSIGKPYILLLSSVIIVGSGIAIIAIVVMKRLRVAVLSNSHFAQSLASPYVEKSKS